ncbi:MAG: ribokinase [Trueperaceae bacterium]|nr:ribokinase [Trueperaceae bacterium]
MTEGSAGRAIAVVGSVNMDLVVRVARHPRPGETLLGSDYATHPGGKGANQAVAAARLGGNVRFVGRVGADAFGTQLAAALQHDGVDIAALGRSARPSGVAFIQVDERGQNSIVVSPGANHDLDVVDLRTGALATASVLMLQLEIPLEVVLAAAAAGRRAGALVMLNLAPARRLEPSQLADVGLLLVNEHEAVIQLGAVAEGKTPEEWAVALCRFVPCAVVTLGADGAVWACRAESVDARGDRDVSAFGRTDAESEGWPGGALHGRVPAFEVNPVDTTAAGDAFAGALAYWLAQVGSARARFGIGVGRDGSAPFSASSGSAHVVEGAGEHPLAVAVRFASAAGALAATRPGAQPSLPILAEVMDTLRGGS